MNETQTPIVKIGTKIFGGTVIEIRKSMVIISDDQPFPKSGAFGKEFDEVEKEVLNGDA